MIIAKSVNFKFFRGSIPNILGRFRALFILKFVDIAKVVFTFLLPFFSTFEVRKQQCCSLLKMIFL